MDVTKQDDNPHSASTSSSNSSVLYKLKNLDIFVRKARRNFVMNGGPALQLQCSFAQQVWYDVLQHLALQPCIPLPDDEFSVLVWSSCFQSWAGPWRSKIHHYLNNLEALEASQQLRLQWHHSKPPVHSPLYSWRGSIVAACWGKGATKLTSPC